MKRFFSQIFVFAIAVIAVAAMVSAAWAIDLPKTGQTTSYDANSPQRDDGALQIGVAWPSPRFTNPDGSTPISGNVVVDQLTGLMWTQDAGTPTVWTCTGGVRTWQQALDYVACLNTNNYLGYNDWRLPNVNELESLINVEQSSTAAWLNLPAQGFSNVQTTGYWSSSSYVNCTLSPCVVTMGDGYVGDYFGISTFYVWPVRAGDGGAPADLPRTGQTTCYDAVGNVIACAGTGQDGELQKGVAWPDPRFADNGNGTVTDNLTGLMWTQNAGTPTVGACTGGTRTWQQALDYVACLNTNNYLGYTDWRLPNRKELRSLINYGQANTTAWLNLPAQGFSNVQTNFYWSSSTYAIITAYAWVVYMDEGDVFAGNKPDSFYVWPVRTGQVGPPPQQYTLTVSKTGTGSGTVTSSPAGINCGTDCSQAYNSGTSVTLTATPDSSSTFAGWSGDADCSDGSVTMDADKTCTATFNTSSSGGNTGGGNGGDGGGGGGGGCGGFIQDSNSKNKDNNSLMPSFILMLILSLLGVSLARRVMRD